MGSLVLIRNYDSDLIVCILRTFNKIILATHRGQYEQYVNNMMVNINIY